MRWLYTIFVSFMFFGCHCSYDVCYVLSSNSSILYVDYVYACVAMGNVFSMDYLVKAKNAYKKTKHSQELYSRVGRIMTPTDFDCQFAAGYFDGDGNFSGKKQVLIRFDTHSDDLEVLLYFRDRWGGRISLTYLNTVSLVLDSNESKQFISDCGPYLQNADRIELGLKFNLDNSQLSKVSPTLESGWLLGLIASDGCFCCDPTMKFYVRFGFKNPTLMWVVEQLCGKENIVNCNPRRGGSDFYFKASYNDTLLLDYLCKFQIPGSIGKALGQKNFVFIVGARAELTRTRQWSVFLRTPSPKRTLVIRAMANLSMSKSGLRKGFAYWQRLCNDYRVF
jgi:hypothetical protein